jgi:hypothetical protein
MKIVRVKALMCLLKRRKVNRENALYTPTECDSVNSLEYIVLWN